MVCSRKKISSFPETMGYMPHGILSKTGQKYTFERYLSLSFQKIIKFNGSCGRSKNSLHFESTRVGSVN